jgi:hypothetical protein
MVAISCFNQNKSVNFTFIEFNQFVKVSVNNRIVILTKKQLGSNYKLLQMFKLSILCTKDTSVATSYIINDTGATVWGVNTQIYWKQQYFSNYEFTQLHSSQFRNPLLAQEPKRASSNKKIKKFMKLFHYMMTERIHDQNAIIRKYYTSELLYLTNYFTRYIEHNRNNRQIQMLSQILHNYGYNVYSSVQQFL